MNPRIEKASVVSLVLAHAGAAGGSGGRLKMADLAGRERRRPSPVVRVIQSRSAPGSLTAEPMRGQAACRS